MSATCDCDLYLANDYLVNKKGYVLLHNPYGYGNTRMANSLYKDE